MSDVNWNEELEEEVTISEPHSLVVYSRDWTVETVVRQIERGNIELNPKFQRRNAWTDDKRSKLIESLLIGVPVPEIVLAEDKASKGSYLVIDGKQRLLAVAGFIEPKFEFWSTPKLRSLKTRKDLIGKSFKDLSDNGNESEDQRALLNSDIRCTVISSYKDMDVLYDIFYRLNAGSVPLSSQELRQALNRGPFADFLIDATNKVIPLHKVLRLEEPDARLRDAEILLRYIAFSLYGTEYAGALSPFLDSTMEKMNAGWTTTGLSQKAEQLYDQFNAATIRLLETLPEHRVGRRFSSDSWEGAFNRALFEVEAFYFSRIPTQHYTEKNRESFVDRFKELCAHSAEFRDTIGATTKTLDRYRTRFTIFQNLTNAAFGTNIAELPLPLAV